MIEEFSMLLKLENSLNKRYDISKTYIIRKSSEKGKLALPIILAMPLIRKKLSFPYPN